MIIIAITGQLATGKSTITQLVKQMGFKVFDSDKSVHCLLKTQDVKKEIKNFFNFKVKNLFKEDGEINNEKLGSYVFKNTSGLKKLEEILHPRVREKERMFLENCCINRMKFVFLDIPLLNETSQGKRCDYIISMFVRKQIQKLRVLRRKMSCSRVKAIIKKQERLKIVSSSEFLIRINSGNGRFFVKKKLIKFINLVKKKKINRVWPNHYKLNVK